jgi:hypothetical protein
MSNSLKKANAERKKILENIGELNMNEKPVPEGISQWPPVHNLRKFRRAAATRKVQTLKNMGSNEIFHPVYSIFDKFQYILEKYDERLSSFEKRLEALERTR